MTELLTTLKRNNNLNRNLKAMSIKQLSRLYANCYSRITKDGFGCDWATLRISRPGMAIAMAAILQEHREKCYQRLQRFASMASRAGSLKSLTRLWNLADHQRDAERYWELLSQIRPEYFRDPTDYNSARFTYYQPLTKG